MFFKNRAKIIIQKISVPTTFKKIQQVKLLQNVLAYYQINILQEHSERERSKCYWSTHAPTLSFLSGPNISRHVGLSCQVAIIMNLSGAFAMRELISPKCFQVNLSKQKLPDLQKK